jgi:hypothetical protein
MARKKVKTAELPTIPEQRKPTRWARIRLTLAKQIDIIVAQNATDFTEEVNRAVREYLERNGKWPVQ